MVAEAARAGEVCAVGLDSVESDVAVGEGAGGS